MIFKSIKKAFVWTVFLLALLVLIIGGGYLLLRSPKVQTRLTQQIASILSKELETKVTVQGVDIGFFNRLILEDLYVQDLKSDTLAFFTALHLGLDYISLENNQMYFDRIRIDDVKFFLHKYQGDEKLNIQFLIDYFTVEKKKDVESWDIRSNELELKNASFKYRDDYHDKANIGVDYWDLDVRKIDLLIDNIKIDIDTIYGNVSHLSCSESSGFQIKNLEGKVKTSSKELLINNLLIKTADSDLDLDLHYTYEHWRDYRSFVDSVRMNYVFNESVINMKDVAFFARGLKGLEEELRISGHIYGAVSSLNGRNLNVWYGNNTNLQGDINMDGLPNIKETFLHFNLKQLSTNYGDIMSIPLPPFDQINRIKLPKNIFNLGQLSFKGSFTGFINDFVAYGKLNTAIGQLKTDVSLKQDDAGTLAYRGSLKSIAFNLGRFLETDKIGEISLDAKVEGKGLSKEDINAKLEGEISSVKLISYEYQNIVVNGTFAKSRFNGDLNIADENVDLTFQGAFDLSMELPEFNFHSNIRHANLYELNLLRKRENATVSGILDVNFQGNSIDNIIGDILISDVQYCQEEDEPYMVNSIQFTVEEDSVSKSLSLRSGIANADFNGKFSFKNIPKMVNNILRKHLPSYARDFENLESNDEMEFDFDIELKNTSFISYLFLPELLISDSSKISGAYSSKRNEINLEGELSKVSYGNRIFKNVNLKAENPGIEFEIGVSSKIVYLSDSIYLRDFSIHTFTFRDSLGLDVRWDNETTLENSGFIKGVGSFPKGKEVSFHLKPSQIVVAGMDWSVRANNNVTIDSSTFSFTDFGFINKNQSIVLDGLISKNENDKLKIALDNFNLSNLNILSSKAGLNLKGTVSGETQVSGVFSKLFFTNQLHLNSLVINDVEIGSGDLNNTWISSTKTVQIFGLLKRNDNTGLSIVGEFLPGKNRPQNFNIKARLDKVPLSVFNPYIEKVISDVSGTMSANLSIKGTVAEPNLTGEAILNDASLLINYLNTNYKISDTIQIKKDGFYFKNLLVQDERDKEGIANGWVKHDNFKKFRFDANMVVANFLVLNTNSAMNSLFYGKSFGTGVVTFSGTPKDMHLDVAMKTDRGTRFNIPLFGSSSVDESGFITFVKPKDIEVDKVDFEKEFQFHFKNLTLNLDVEVTPDAEVQLIFDPKVGDIIKGRGTGDIRMSLDNAGSFKMFGDYYIDKGEYLFTLQNVINKKFLIKQGGIINWSGSPYDAFVDIEATYGVRTSLYDLMYPDTANNLYKKRVQVDCILKMTGNLLTPNIEFDVDLPNSDETTRTEVRNRIGIGNVQEMNRQVFGLLVLNKFFPTENQASNFSTGGLLSSSTAEVLSNQLSNWLSKISNDFDVGLNYRPGDGITNDEVELALSTQVFNNRIIIDGNVGVSKESSTQTNSSGIVGDVNIEYKITADGRFRVKAFNKSNDINAYTQNAPFTQGVGISYQKDFNKLGDLFRRRNKKKRESQVKLSNP